MTFYTATACAVLIGACTHASVLPEPPIEPEPEAPAGPETNDARFHADLLSIAGNYYWMHRADGVWWSPVSCMAPPANPAFISRAKSGGHGRKLYTIFVEDYDAYAGRPRAKPKPPKRPRKPGELVLGGDLDRFPQVVVKEAWTPIRSADRAANCPQTSAHLEPVTADGVEYKACKPAALFVMYRVPDGADTDGTDDGWVYGTVQDDGQRSLATPNEPQRESVVTSAGRVASCMRCHQRAPQGRLFGPQRSR